MPLSVNQLNEAFALLESAAAAGERCPQSRPHGPLHSAACSELARAGRIRVELYLHNWRVVTMMEGAAQGQAYSSAPKPECKAAIQGHRER